MKVNLGFAFGRKNERNLSHDISTTSDFGYVQPLVARRLHADDSLSVRVADIVRLQPLVKPTFGSIQLKKYFRYVKVADIWHAYESMLTGQTYAGANATYIPTAVPTVQQDFLTRLVCMFSDIYCWDSSVAPAESDGTFSMGSIRGVSANDCETNYFDYQLNKGLYSGDGDKAFSEYLYSKMGFKPFYAHATDTWDSSSNYVPIESMDYYDVNEVEGVYHFFGFKLNRFGRNLRKILIGNGYQMNWNKSRVEIVKLFANYKAYFDEFMPSREITWKDTNAFKVMESVEQNNTPHIDEQCYESSDFTDGLLGFIWDLVNMYYTQNPDFVSAHITGNRNSIVPTGALRIQSPAANDPHNVQVTGENSQAKMNMESVGSISAQMLDVLKKMTQRVAIHSQLGGRIKEFMKLVYGSEYVNGHDSDSIGTDVSDIQIGDVFSTAETAEGYLGEYAGRGIGTNSGKYLKFRCSADGYLFVLGVIVPDAKYCQGVDTTLLMTDKYSCYDPAFDGLTLLPTPKFGIYGIQEFPHVGDSSAGFGNMPIYSGTKIALNKLNGDISLPSTRESYLPFTLDKMLPYSIKSVGRQTVDTSTGQIHKTTGFVFKQPAMHNITAGTIWRYIGRDRWNGNEDRIFVNEGNGQEIHYDSESGETKYLYAATPMDDNFIIQSYVDLKVFGNPKSLADSWYTDSEGASISVENA